MQCPKCSADDWRDTASHNAFTGAPIVACNACGEYADKVRFEWKVARTIAHLHLEGRYTGISLPIRSDRAWRASVLEALGLPELPLR